jgi:energy-coupling factor transporter ATP-binding protein EcfA2
VIRSLKAVNLNRRMTFDLQFYEDINIVTGKNGSGKTTLLKLLWYAISGNLERIIPEIAFDSFELVTDKLSISMSVEARQKRKIIRLKYQAGDVEREVERPVERSVEWDDLEQANRAIVWASGSSIFFPTFRRIEGGFSISTYPNEDVERFINRTSVPRARNLYFAHERSGLQYEINRLSDRLSVGPHRFVASISTDDIVRLLTSKYAEISERTNRLHMELSRFILKRVRDGPSSDVNMTRSIEERESREALDDIRQQARNVTQESEALLRPFTILSELIATRAGKYEQKTCRCLDCTP